MAPTHEYRRSALVTSALACLLVAAGFASAVKGQPEFAAENPVFVDEAPIVVESLSRVSQFVAGKNPDQAVRLLQRLLDEFADTMVTSPGDNGLYIPVRQRVHAILLENPDLLALYRDLMTASAKEQFDGGQVIEVERSRFLTGPGLDATLALARTRLLTGQIDDAARLLGQLAEHPDRIRRQKEIGPVAAMIVPYVEAGERRVVLESMLTGEVPAMMERPAGLTPLPTMMQPSPRLNLDGLVPKPISSVAYADTTPIRPHHWNGAESSLDQLPLMQRELRVWPAITPRVAVIVQDQTIAAYDRITLRELWKHDVLTEHGLIPADDPGERIIGGLRQSPVYWSEEITQPTPIGATVLAVVSHDAEMGTSGEGEEYLVSIETDSGRIRWIRKLTEIDPTLVKTFARGPIVTDGQIAVISMYKRQPERRLIAATLLGVDAFTGEKRWSRLVGSAGVLPYAGQSKSHDMASASRGVVYRSDRLGVVGAYRISDGRPLWLRRLGSKLTMEMGPPSNPWLVASPVVTERGVFVLNSERDQIVQLDPETGAVLAMRAAKDLSEPLYLLRCGEHLVGVSEIQVATVPMGAFEHGPVAVSGRIGAVGAGIRGRVTVAEGQLIVPTGEQVTILNPAEPVKMDRVVKIDASGGVISLPEGLLVVDDSRLHVYSTWAVASAHLKTQIAAAPNDPAPAAELLALAERVNQPAEVLPAAALAAAAIDKAERGGEGVARQRTRVIETLLQIAAGTGGPNAAQLDDAGTDAALAQAGALARSARERVSHQLVLAGVHERRGQWTQAATIYHRVLSDADLAGASYSGERGVNRAEIEVVDRLRVLLSTGGRGSCAEFDAAFDAADQALGNGTVAELEALTQKYPVARNLPGLWLRIAQKQTDQPKAEARALELGVQAAERMSDAPAEIVGELNGRLIENLLARNLVIAAADAVRRAKDRFPGAPLRTSGGALDRASLDARIEQLMASTRRWPRVGEPLGEPRPQVLEGWALMDPLIPTTGGVAAPFLVMQRGDEKRTQVALFGFASGALAGEASTNSGAPLTELWASEKTPDYWQLLRTDVHGAVFVIGESAGASLVRVDAGTGKQVWKSEAFGKLFPGDAPLRFGAQNAREAALVKRVEQNPLSEMLIATDDRTVALLERSGRCASIDVETGRVLWTSTLPLTRIRDFDVVGGQLIVTGESMQPPQDGKLDRIALIDARSGNTLSSTPCPVAAVQWVRVTPRGDLIICGRGQTGKGGEPIGGSIVCVAAPDLDTGKTAWTLAGHPSINNIMAWLVDDRLFVLNDDRTLWEINARTGAVPKAPIDTHGRFDARTGITVSSGPRGIAFATGRGVVLIGPDGLVAGVDAINPNEAYASPAPADGGFAFVAASQNGGRDGFVDPAIGGGSTVMTYVIHRVDATSCALVSSTPFTVGAVPRRVGLMDGRIAVTAGFSTLVFAAPAK